MLRELNLNEMETVSGGDCDDTDFDCKELADDPNQTDPGSILTIDNIVVTGTVSAGATAGAEAGAGLAGARFGSSVGRVGGFIGSAVGGIFGLFVGAAINNLDGNTPNPSNFTPFPNGRDAGILQVQ